MKNQLKFIGLFVGLAVILSGMFTLSVYGVLAQTDQSDQGTTSTSTNMSSTTNQTGTNLSGVVMNNTTIPMVVDINSNGSVLLRGIVQSIGSSSAVISTWGGNWTVDVGTGVAFTSLPSGASDLSGLSAGDYVGVLGYVSTSQPFTVNAYFVRDWTKTSMTTGTTGATGTTGTMNNTGATSTTGSGTINTGTTGTGGGY